MLTPATSFAWWDTGHMAVAAIAYQNLNPETRAWVDDLVGELAFHYPDAKTFIECSTWADDLKNQGVYAYNSWHYTNIPYNPEKLPLPENAIPEVNVVWAINQSRTVLESEKAVPLEKARFLAFLVHFVGDLHQPMHSTSMYSSAVPQGDRGGNDFPLKDPVMRNMHMLWDDGCGFFDEWDKNNRLERPLNQKGLNLANKMASDIAALFPKDYLDDSDNLDPDFWAEQSHDLAVRHVFNGSQFVNRGGTGQSIQHGDLPSLTYIENGQKVVARQVALAGYRLANMLNEIYASL